MQFPKQLDQLVVEVAIFLTLAVAAIPVAFGTFGQRTTLALIGLVTLPLIVALIAAWRQPEHTWLLAVETWAGSLMPQIAAESRFPSGQPMAVVLLESTMTIIPAAWVAALIGRSIARRRDTSRGGA